MQAHARAWRSSDAAVASSPAIAALCFGLAILISERGLTHSRAWNEAVHSLRGLVRLQIGALLACAITTAGIALTLPGWPFVLPTLVGFVVGGSALVLLGGRHRVSPAQTGWLLILLALLHATVAFFAHTPASVLTMAFVVAFGFALGLPAFLALAERMDDYEVPGFMRPLPARVLAIGVVCLALGSLASW